MLEKIFAIIKKHIHFDVKYWAKCTIAEITDIDMSLDDSSKEKEFIDELAKAICKADTSQNEGFGVPNTKCPWHCLDKDITGAGGKPILPPFCDHADNEDPDCRCDIKVCPIIIFNKKMWDK